jgi:PRTRC genetic system protein A
MATNADFHPYLSDPFDKAVCGNTPTLMAPIRGTLKPPEVGGYRYVAASDGLHIEARTGAVEARLPKARTRLPYGDVKDGVRLVHGRIPFDLLYCALSQSLRDNPDEWAGLIVWNGNTARYELFNPDVVSASGSHVSYRDTLPDGCERVVDLHSHSKYDAFFSPDDDQSDGNGVYIAGVIGKCGSFGSQEMVFRMVIYGQFFPVKLSGSNHRFWFEPARGYEPVLATEVFGDAAGLRR